MIEDSKSHIKILSSLKTFYGVIEGINEYRDYQKESDRMPDSVIYYSPVPKTYEEFEQLRKQTPTVIGGYSIPKDIISMINNALDGSFVIWKGKYQNYLIFQSTNLPKVGFVVEVKENG